MRKVLLFVFLLVCSYTFGQPIVNRAGAANTVADANLFALRSFRPPVYADTTAANNAYPTLDSAGKVFYSFNDKAIWFRQHSPKKWVKLADQNLVNNVTGCYGLLNGGIVTWSGVGLVMNVTASYYVINCNYYNADGSLSVTLSTADPTNPRIDVIAVDTAENIVVITGTPGATPVKPQVNPTYQVELTYVYVPAGATTPNGYTYKTVYNENVEWTSGSTLSSGTVNFNSTVFPSVGTKNLRVASGTIGNVYWDTTGAFLTSNYQSLSLRFSLASSPTNDMLPYIYLRDNGVQVTYSLALDGFGYSSVSGINEYNVVTVPMSAFTFTSGSTFDGIGLYFGGIGAIIDVDYVQLQTGTNGGGVTPQYIFTGGITESGGTVKLGGALVNNTSITNPSGYSFDIHLNEDNDMQGLIGDTYNSFIGFANGSTLMSASNGNSSITLGNPIEIVSSGATTSSINVSRDNVSIYPNNGKLYLDSLNTVSSTTGKKIMLRDTATGLVQNIDPALLRVVDTSYTTIATFTAGGGFASDTTMCTDSTLFGSFFTGQFDYTIAYIQAVIKGNAGDSIVLKLVYNDTFNVDGTKVNGAGLSVNNRYTGNVFTISTNRTIAANTWVWLKPEAVITGKKPKYISVTLVGYKTYVTP
jgi:hypothetical protein